MEHGKVNKELIKCLAKARFLSKRNVGISATRSDGSECSIQNDIDATGAEYYAAQQFGAPFDSSIGKSGDGGSDFSLNVSVEVVWLGRDKKTGKPRTQGNLIINPHEPQRWADIYIVIGGSIDDGFYDIGWMSHKELISNPQKDFGYGPRFAVGIERLRPTKQLKTLLRNI